MAEENITSQDQQGSISKDAFLLVSNLMQASRDEVDRITLSNAQALVRAAYTDAFNAGIRWGRRAQQLETQVVLGLFYEREEASHLKDAEDLEFTEFRRHNKLYQSMFPHDTIPEI